MRLHLYFDNRLSNRSSYSGLGLMVAANGAIAPTVQLVSPVYSPNPICPNAHDRFGRKS